MLLPQSLFLQQALSKAAFENLRGLLQQMAQTTGGLYFDETVLPPEQNLFKSHQKQFSVALSTQLCVLLQGDITHPDLYQVELTLEAEAIANFLTQLSHSVSEVPIILTALNQVGQLKTVDNTEAYKTFVLQLVEAINTAPIVNSSFHPQNFASYPVCAPVEAALRQQVEQERLLNQVTTQIRQSLELPVILETAVQHVRHYLQSDRLVIYQFSSAIKTAQFSRPASAELKHLQMAEGCWGQITYEARATETILSVLHLMEGGDCYIDVPNCREKYRKGFTLAVEDTTATYHNSPCLMELLQRAQVRAKLVAPIVVQEELWGLLIAHQCFEPRQWQETEKVFLQQIAEHLAIAIYQSELYAEVQQQKQNLEQRVIERTQELRDALVASQSASRAKSEFLAMMSHELRTPLTCIIGMSSTLLRWSFGELTQKQRDYLSTIHKSGEHLLELINDILDLSQVEAGKTILNSTEFSLSKLAHQCLQTLKENAYRNQVELKIELNIEPEHDRFIADNRRVRQILLNLLSNAIKFTPVGGRVVLRVSKRENFAIFQVEDTGIGIAKNQFPLLFEKFQQLDGSYRRKYEGTGLGLALTKQLVELHNGKIDVKSSVGKGSTFTVWLPAQSVKTNEGKGTKGEVNSASTNPLSPAQRRVVLIEDHEETAMLICDLLTAAEYQVVWLMEGMTAVRQIEILQPAIVITDIQLPGMDGYEIINYLRRHAATQHIKILALTAKAMPGDQERCLQTGANDYLAKPIQAEQLITTVTNLISTDTITVS